MLIKVASLAEVAEIILHHHERIDGRGYPDGLKDAAIPLGARIIAVCDAFDAMTSNRSYRCSVCGAQALAELRRCAGSQFDPNIVSAFSKMMQKPATAGVIATSG